MARQQIVWVIHIASARGTKALYANASGHPTPKLTKAAKFLTRGACQAFMAERDFGKTTHPEQVGITIQDE